MRRFAAVTTCHDAGYRNFGRDMVASFDRHWPQDVPLYLYAEGFTAERPSARIVVRDLLEDCPGLVAFKERHKNNALAHGAERRKRIDFRIRWRKRKMRLRWADWGEGFRWDAVRFSHKTYAIFDAAARCDADVLFWLDADTLFFNDMTQDVLEDLIPADCMLGYLRRQNISECGFVAYNLRHPQIREFLADFERMYGDDKLFKEREYHDSYLFDVVRKRYERRGCRTYDIAEGIGLTAPHVLINSRLGRYMDHMKGERKTDGTSDRKELLVDHDSDYWQSKERPKEKAG